MEETHGCLSASTPTVVAIPVIMIVCHIEHIFAHMFFCECAYTGPTNLPDCRCTVLLLSSPLWFVVVLMVVVVVVICCGRRCCSHRCCCHGYDNDCSFVVIIVVVIIVTRHRH